MLLFPTGVSGATDSSSMLLAISWRISSVIDSARDRGRVASRDAVPLLYHKYRSGRTKSYL